jgi:uncharacterized damage-inducible protein DinB
MTKYLLTAAVAVTMSAPLALTAQTGPVGASLKGLHDVTQTNITATATMLDEALYAFRPTEEVRSMGQLLAHIAGAQFAFCSGAAGESNPNSENFEETRTTKAGIVEALEMGFAYCEEVYANTTDAKGAGAVNFFGSPNTAFGVLAFNSAHNYEHYGNLVTYMRLNGITPPSSM